MIHRTLDFTQSRRSLQNSVRTWPHCPYNPVLGHVWARAGLLAPREGACGVAGVEGSGGAGSSREGACGVAGVEAWYWGFCGFWFHLCYSWLGSAPEVVTPEMGPYLNHLSSFVSVLPLGSLL